MQLGQLSLNLAGGNWRRPFVHDCERDLGQPGSSAQFCLDRYRAPRAEVARLHRRILVLEVKLIVYLEKMTFCVKYFITFSIRVIGTKGHVTSAIGTLRGIQVAALLLLLLLTVILLLLIVILKVKLLVRLTEANRIEIVLATLRPVVLLSSVTGHFFKRLRLSLSNVLNCLFIT